MRLKEILKRMFVERYCVICGEAISHDEEEAFCGECSEHWKEFLAVKCRNCGRVGSMCTCLPSKVKKINHSVASWCVFYDASTNGEINRLFTRMKRRYDREIIDLCTERMKKSIIALFKKRGYKVEEFVVTYAPRKRGNAKKYGFDQSKKLAKSLARKLGIKYIKMFKNNAQQEQKGLSKQERAINAQQSYVYVGGSMRDNKKIIIVDDIMTSGATLYACAFQLYKNGAETVVPSTFAKDNYRERGVKKHVKRNTTYHFSRAVKGFVRNGTQ